MCFAAAADGHRHCSAWSCSSDHAVSSGWGEATARPYERPGCVALLEPRGRRGPACGGRPAARPATRVLQPRRARARGAGGGGEAIVRARPRAQAEGLRVSDVVVLIDREQGGAARMASNGLALHSAFTLTFILDVLVRRALVQPGCQGGVPLACRRPLACQQPSCPRPMSTFTSQSRLAERLTRSMNVRPQERRPVVPWSSALCKEAARAAASRRSAFPCSPRGAADDGPAVPEQQGVAAAAVAAAAHALRAARDLHSWRAGAVCAYAQQAAVVGRPLRS